MSIAGFHLEPVVSGTCRNEDILRWAGEPGGAGQPCEFIGVVPDAAGDFDFRERALVASDYFLLVVAPRSDSKLEPDWRAPARFAGIEEILDSFSHGEVAIGAQLVDPRGRVHEGHLE